MFAALWSKGSPALTGRLGTSTQLAHNAAAVRSFVVHAAAHPGLSIQGFFSQPARVLAYAYVSGRARSGPVVYAEATLPAKPRVPPTHGTPFSDLRFALYLGRHASPRTLIETNTGSLGPRTASTVVPFGNRALTVVAAPNGTLGGALSAALWWIIAVAGVTLSLLAGGMTERLVRGRQAAEVLAADVQRLLDRQQAISLLLQRAMIPPEPSGPDYLEIASRYLPGGTGLELGGDWFDVVELDANRAFVSIGDVSGRGISAGTVMASLRSAIRAFVSEGHGPAEVLERLGPLLSTSEGGRFATVECAVLDRQAKTVTAASAGHLPALVIRPGSAEYLEIPVGPPIGVAADNGTYQESTFQLQPGAVILLFTDGLIERRGESIDDGLSRLREIAARTTGSVDEIVDRISGELGAASTDDDTAMLGVRVT
jgi:serine phosphatase RsbU (regulator of sigma subunit)